MGKQLSIQGTEDEVDADVREAAKELRSAKLDQKRASERVSRAMSLLVQRMLDRKVKGCGFTEPDGRYSLELDLPQPTVKLAFHEETES